jgi:GGDEF domain-containing protein
MMLLERELKPMGLRNGESLAVLFIMLDNLRSTIRDSAGVATADEVVGQAANRLRNLLNQSSLRPGSATPFSPSGA